MELLFARFVTVLAVIGISQGKISGRSAYGFTNILTGRIGEGCHLMDNDPIECRFEGTCTYCCSNDMCYDKSTFVAACPIGCQSWCGDQERCIESDCSYNVCTNKCTSKKAGCHLNDGLGVEACMNAGCFPCQQNGYVYCLPERPADPNECNAEPDPVVGHFFEGCGDLVGEFANITLPMKSTCLNLPPTKTGLGTLTWRETVSEVWLPKHTCLVLYDDLNCCGHKVIITNAMNNLCPGGVVAFNDIAQSYRLC